VKILLIFTDDLSPLETDRNTIGSTTREEEYKKAIIFFGILFTSYLQA